MTAMDEWRTLVANDEQLLGTRIVRVVDGSGDGVRLLEAWTPSGLSVDVLLDRGFDLFTVRLHGRPISWMGPPGLKPRTTYEPAGFGWLNTFHGGLMVTCGLDHFGGPQSRPVPEHMPPDDRIVDFGEHGRVSHESARLVGCDVIEDAGIRSLRLIGSVAQSSLYGSQFELRRTIDLGIDTPTINVHDVVCNVGPLPVPQAMLYHVNFGYPLVRPGATVAALGTDRAYEHVVSSCEPTSPETVTPWSLARDELGRSRVSIEGHGCTVTMEYAADTLPAFFLWTLPRTRANVVGFAPASASAATDAEWLEPSQTRQFELLLTIEETGPSSE